LDKRDERCAEGAKEADHYEETTRELDSERLKSVLRNVLF
jgi:hypothetical protein